MLLRILFMKLQQTRRERTSIFRVKIYPSGGQAGPGSEHQAVTNENVERLNFTALCEVAGSSGSQLNRLPFLKRLMLLLWRWQPPASASNPSKCHLR